MADEPLNDQGATLARMFGDAQTEPIPASGPQRDLGETLRAALGIEPEPVVKRRNIYRPETGLVYDPLPATGMDSLAQALSDATCAHNWPAHGEALRMGETP